jgi:hypothetical protein
LEKLNQLGTGVTSSLPYYHFYYYYYYYWVAVLLLYNLGILFTVLRTGSPGKHNGVTSSNKNVEWRSYNRLTSRDLNISFREMISKQMGCLVIYHGNMGLRPLN